MYFMFILCQRYYILICKTLTVWNVMVGPFKLYLFSVCITTLSLLSLNMLSWSWQALHMCGIHANSQSNCQAVVSVQIQLTTERCTEIITLSSSMDKRSTKQSTKFRQSLSDLNTCYMYIYTASDYHLWDKRHDTLSIVTQNLHYIQDMVIGYIKH